MQLVQVEAWLAPEAVEYLPAAQFWQLASDSLGEAVALE